MFQQLFCYSKQAAQSVPTTPDPRHGGGTVNSVGPVKVFIQRGVSPVQREYREKLRYRLLESGDTWGDSNSPCSALAVPREWFRFPCLTRALAAPAGIKPHQTTHTVVDRIFHISISEVRAGGVAERSTQAFRRPGQPRPSHRKS